MLVEWSGSEGLTFWNIWNLYIEGVNWGRVQLGMHAQWRF